MAGGRRIESAYPTPDGRSGYNKLLCHGPLAPDKGKDQDRPYGLRHMIVSLAEASEEQDKAAPAVSCIPLSLAGGK